MSDRLSGLLAAVLFGLLAAWAGSAAAVESFQKWEKDIAKFEEQDAKQPPQSGGIVFVGSSSIRLWDTDKFFPGQKIINRGFGGSQIADSVHFVDRIVTLYKPREVVLYAGDNDLAAGKSPEQLAADFRAFVKGVHAKVPDAEITFIAIKPSPSRLNLLPKAREANEAIQTICDSNPLLTYLDIFSPMLDENGSPRQELFVADMLHLNEKGYVLWTKLLKPYLEEKE